MADKTVFQTLNELNVNGHTEKKKTGNVELTYLSWPWAWASVKKLYEDSSYEIKFFDGLPYIFDEKTGYIVFTSVTIGEITHEMWLPVMDGANQAMKAEPYTYAVKEYKYGKWTGNYVDKTVAAATMMDINKTIMRCLVKNLAMFGLGLYIYAGEDLPEGDPEEEADAKRVEKLRSAKLTETEAIAFRRWIKEHGINEEKLLEGCKVSTLEQLSLKKYRNILDNPEKAKEVWT